MKLNYDELGNHIQLVDRRNKDMVSDKVLGISIDKYFMPSVANVIGTDLSKYKLIQKNNFACNPMHVGRDERLPIVLYEDEVPAIVSPAYFMFEIKAESVLLPEYLMMWFRRPEFDRACWFKTDGSVRGGISWEEICRLEIPVPSLEKQREFINSYKAITERITLKQKINDNLADTINSAFLDLYSALDEENTQYFEEICTVTSSKRVFAEDYAEQGIPFYRGKEISLKQAGQPITDPLFIEESHFKNLKDKYGIPQCGDILITAVGTIGNSYLVQDEEFYFKDGNIIWLKDFNAGINYYVYDYMQSSIFKQILEGISIGSTQTALTISSLSKLQINIPPENVLSSYVNKSKKIRIAIEANTKEIVILHKLQELLLSELSN